MPRLEQRRTARTPTEDVEYPPYERYLTQDRIWPSVRGGVPQTVAVPDMAPQHGASALAKLLRWEAEYYGGAQDTGVLISPLALALADRALNGQLQNIVDAVVSSSEPATGAEPLAGQEGVKALAVGLDASGDYTAGELVSKAFAIADALEAAGIELRRKA